MELNECSSDNMTLRNQKRVAARIMKCGVTRVWINPERIKDAQEAITGQDIRRLVNDGIIKKLPKQGLSSYRRNKIRLQKKKGRRQGIGKRKGHAGDRKKRSWIKRIRVLRRTLKELKQKERITNKTYWKMYRTAKSGFFRSKAHLISHLEKNELLKEGKKE